MKQLKMEKQISLPRIGNKDETADEKVKRRCNSLLMERKMVEME